MPILSYFLVVGSVLTGLLLWFAPESQPNDAVRMTSQTVGVAKFKPEPEPTHAQATAVNYAAAYERPETKTVKAVEPPRRQKATVDTSTPWRPHRFAEYPHDNLSIH
jgi:hypothetical protein